MTDISKLMQNAAILEVIDQSADEASSLSAQNSYQAMRIEELEAENAALKADEKKLRHLLFMAHGSEEHYLYGDDGERHCNACWIDFNKDSPDEIERKIYEYNMRKLIAKQAAISAAKEKP